MKILGTKQSNRGHKKIDYILSVSDIEINELKRLLLNKGNAIITNMRRLLLSKLQKL